MTIQHIAFEADWRQAQRTGSYDRSTRGASIDEVGFLHASAGRNQVDRVLEYVFADVTDPLVLLTLDEAALAAAGLRIVMEPGNPVDPDSERFPHVYGGPLPVGAVSRVEAIAPPGRGAEEWYLARAIELATGNAATDGGPFGAVVVTADGRAFEGTNRVTAAHDPTAHAEVTALRAACADLQTFELEGAVVYASCEPCPMCLGAALWARVGRVVYAADRHDAAAAGFDDAAFYDYFTAPGGGTLMPLEHHATDGATAPFDAWRANAERIDY